MHHENNKSTLKDHYLEYALIYNDLIKLFEEHNIDTKILKDFELAINNILKA